jgi:hypothetical protein
MWLRVGGKPSVSAFSIQLDEVRREWLRREQNSKKNEAVPVVMAAAPLDLGIRSSLSMAVNLHHVCKAIAACYF